VPGLGRVKGDFGGFLVTCFTHENDVRIKTEKRSQEPGETETDLRIDLGLHDAGEIVLNGIFGGDDLYAGVINIMECGIQGGGFPTAGWATDKDHSGRTS